MKYKPGTIMGGRINNPFQCDVSRSIGYYLEPLIVLCLFAKEPLNIRLKGYSYTCSSFYFIVSTYNFTKQVENEIKGSI